MSTAWKSIAEGMPRGLGVEPGEHVHLRDRKGSIDVLLEISLVMEAAGATPPLETTPPEYLENLLARAPVGYLEKWDRHRGGRACAQPSVPVPGREPLNGRPKRNHR